jgi:plasmid rolling circle replication initiator protein Rep
LFDNNDYVVFDAEKMDKIKDQRSTSFRYAAYLERLKSECISMGSVKESGMERWERIRLCLSKWEWDIYHDDLLMDLQKVMRCHDHRWCANCRRVYKTRALLQFAPYFADFIRKGYNPYLVTLTVPNVSGEYLRMTIDRMQIAFRRLWKWYSLTNNKKFKDRCFIAVAGIRQLEITKNHGRNTYHPHYHILFFTDGSESLGDFKKDTVGEYSRKSDSVNMLCTAELQLRQMWYRAYNHISRTAQCDGSYLCDMEPMRDHNGIFEVFKYTFKDTDITDYETFKTIYLATDGKRLRQGLGLLYNYKTDDDDGQSAVDINDLLKKIDDRPESLVTTFKDLYSPLYQGYRKISRFGLKFVDDD